MVSEQRRFTEKGEWSARRVQGRDRTRVSLRSLGGTWGGEARDEDAASHDDGRHDVPRQRMVAKSLIDPHRR